MPFCDNCGTQLKDSDKFCPSCGKENLNRPAKVLPGYEEDSDPYAQKPPASYQAPNQSYARPPQQYQPNYPPANYQQGPNAPQYNSYVKRAVNSPFAYKIAPLGDRCIAYIIDGFLTAIGSCPCFCYLPGIFYGLFKDGMRQGQSFGKGATNLRVINFNTGMPATPVESCVRNFCNVCVCWLLFEPNQRHIGDLIAGTIVIKDE